MLTDSTRLSAHCKSCYLFVAQGSQVTYTISGGYCVLEGKAGPVTCSKPTAAIVKVRGTPWPSALLLTG